MFGKSSGKRILALLGAVVALCALGTSPASAESVGPGPYIIMNNHSHLCVDVAYGSVSSGARVQQWDCYGGTPEQWRFEYFGHVGSEPYYRVVNVNSNKCLDVRDGHLGNGGIIQQYDCWNGRMQLWTPRTTPLQHHVWLVNRNSDRCLDNTGWSTSPGTSLQQVECGRYTAQYWRLYPA